MVCNARGCGEEGSCSVLPDGFRKTSLKDGTEVFTAEYKGASLSITGGDSTTLSCDEACECQQITNKLGCSVSSSAGDRSEASRLVDDNGEEYIKFNQAQSEQSRASAVSIGGSIAFAFVVSVIEKLVQL